MDIQWPLVFFTLFTGMGVGAFSCVAITEWLGIAESIRMPGAITALAAMAVGGVASVFHLSHAFRTYNILKHLDTGVGKEMLLIGLTGFLILAYCTLLSMGFWDQARKIVAAIGLVSGVVLAFEMGAIYVLPARPGWNTWFWPFIYASSAAVTGLFAMYFWAAAFKGHMEEAVVLSMNKATLIALIIQAGTILAYMIFLGGAPYADPTRKPARLLTGDSAVPFWGGVVLAGLVIPLGLTVWLQVGQTAHFSLSIAVVGFIGVLVGGISIRALMYNLGTEIDPIL